MSIKLACEVLENMTLTGSRNSKIALLQGSKCKELEFLLETALNPYMRYGVKEVADVATRDNIPSLEELKELREELLTRKVTGNAARDRISQCIGTKNELARRWLKNVFMKDLTIGASISTINKVFKDLIPEFNVMLCSKEDKGYSGPWLVQPKFDGLRCIMIFDGSGEVLSRNGRPLYNLDHIYKQLELHAKGFVLDGEAMGVDWNESASVIRASKTKKASKQLKFHVFDIMTLEEWKMQKSNYPLYERKHLLEKQIPKLPDVIQVPSYKVETLTEAWEYAKKFLDKGYEGAVAKKISTYYEWGRSPVWLKLKFEEDYDVEIVEFYEGTGKHQGRLGGFICKMPNGQNVRIGGGYNDEEREEFWKNRKTMIGKTIEVKGQSLTKDGSLRFPVFMRLREDK